MKSSNLQLVFVILFFISFTMLSSCAEPQALETCVEGKPAGFLSGAIHGVIAPISFFLSLFMDNVAIYDVHNNGGWYDFGFVLGAGILFGGGSKASKKKK